MARGLVSFALLSLLLRTCSYGFSPSDYSIHHSNEPFSLPPHTPSCILTGLHQLIASISNASAYDAGSALERRVACGAEHENVLLRLRLRNPQGSALQPPHSKLASELGVTMKKQFGRLLQELSPTLQLRYRWVLIMRGHYWMAYHTVSATRHVVGRRERLPHAAAAAAINQSGAGVTTGRKELVGDGVTKSMQMRSGGFGDGGSGFGGESKYGKKRGMAKMGNEEGEMGDAGRGQNEHSRKLAGRKDQAMSGFGNVKAGNYRSTGNAKEEAEYISGFGDAKSGFGYGESGLDSCLPRGDVLVSHTRGGAGGDEGFEILKAPNALVSHNNQFYMRMQGDCNLVLYTASGVALWSSFTRDNATQCSLSLLYDGSLVISSGSSDNTIVWSSHPPPPPPTCPSIFIFILQDDGNAVIYNMLSGLPIWATGTNQ